ncbi:MAG: NADH-quinone oxidoreductase subunit B [Thermococci archaeon]|nr:NADH-quinone oxidoreductase subunit B [Thermococci archaeon]
MEQENERTEGYDRLSYPLKEFKVFEPLFRWARKKSIWIITFCTGCGGIEMPPLMNARYDLERFGMMPNPSPRMADLFLITGYVTPKTLKRIIITYEMMEDPKYIMSHGSCPINGGVYWDSYNVVKQLDRYIPIDVSIAGCMPRVEAVMDGIMEIMRKVERGEADGWKRYRDNYEWYRRNQDELFGKGWRKETARRWLKWL